MLLTKTSQNKQAMRSLLFLAIALFAANTMVAQTKRQKIKPVCSADCDAKNSKAALSCKLTSPELQQRKQTVIASLKAKVVSRKGLRNGYQYTFAGNDAVVDELVDFIKTERQCCDFFIFNLSISGDKQTAKMEITGPKGAKEFIDAELAL